MPADIETFSRDLLAAIFRYGAQLNRPHEETPFLLKASGPSEDYFYSSSFQMTVSSVNRRWRTIALDDPTLWNTIHFRTPSDIQKARLFLSRTAPRSSVGMNAMGFPEYPDQHLLDILILTVAPHEYIEGENLSQTELAEIFSILTPETLRWRTFYLKVEDNECRLRARRALTQDCGPAPNLVTLQLYHFEDYANSDDLWNIIHRPPRMCFRNIVPSLKHVSLIGVNLPWHSSPYLGELESLELALHPEKIRPPYECWEMMLRSPNLKSLSILYSGPKEPDGYDVTLVWPTPDSGRRITLDHLEHLKLSDLDPDYLITMLELMLMPNVQRLELDLIQDDGDYSRLLELCVGEDSSSSSGAGELTQPLFAFLPSLMSLKLSALDSCSIDAFKKFIYSLTELRGLELNFGTVCVGEDIWRLFVGENFIGSHSPTSTEGGEVEAELEKTLDELEIEGSGPSSEVGSGESSSGSQESLIMFLPKLEVFTVQGLSGRRIRSMIMYREDSLRSGVASTQNTRYIIKYTQKMVLEDPVLKEMIDTGYCWFPNDDRRMGSDVEHEAGNENNGWKVWVDLELVVEDEE
ncbi:hypothetical protein VKT23_001476 [Stygiomarasmius scandens]|uniref:F-box domain-containing protein n=1 Tax=Marasmiellus scandens TaxID=2682957 RepID=A0ABR1JYY9_9AGAR